MQNQACSVPTPSARPQVVAGSPRVPIRAPPRAYPTTQKQRTRKYYRKHKYESHATTTSSKVNPALLVTPKKPEVGDRGVEAEADLFEEVEEDEELSDEYTQEHGTNSSCPTSGSTTPTLAKGIGLPGSEAPTPISFGPTPTTPTMRNHRGSRGEGHDHPHFEAGPSSQGNHTPTHGHPLPDETTPAGPRFQGGPVQTPTTVVPARSYLFSPPTIQSDGMVTGSPPPMAITTADLLLQAVRENPQYAFNSMMGNIQERNLLREEVRRLTLDLTTRTQELTNKTIEFNQVAHKAAGAQDLSKALSEATMRLQEAGEVTERKQQGWKSMIETLQILDETGKKKQIILHKQIERLMKGAKPARDGKYHGDDTVLNMPLPIPLLGQHENLNTGHLQFDLPTGVTNATLMTWRELADQYRNFEVMKEEMEGGEVKGKFNPNAQSFVPSNSNTPIAKFAAISISTPSAGSSSHASTSFTPTAGPHNLNFSTAMPPPATPSTHAHPSQSQSTPTPAPARRESKASPSSSMLTASTQSSTITRGHQAQSIPTGAAKTEASSSAQLPPVVNLTNLPPPRSTSEIALTQTLSTIPPQSYNICPFSLTHTSSCPRGTDCKMQQLCITYNDESLPPLGCHPPPGAECISLHEYKSCENEVLGKVCEFEGVGRKGKGKGLTDIQARAQAHKRVRMHKSQCSKKEWQARLAAAACKEAHREGTYFYAVEGEME